MEFSILGLRNQNFRMKSPDLQMKLLKNLVCYLTEFLPPQIRLIPEDPTSDC